MACQVRLGDDALRRLPAVPKVATVTATVIRPAASIVTATRATSASRGAVANAVAAVTAAVAVASLAAGAAAGAPTASTAPQPLRRLV